MNSKLTVIANKIRHLYRNKETKEELVRYVNSLSDENIESVFAQHLISSHGIELSDAILSSYSNNDEAQKKKFKLITCILNNIRSSTTPSIMVREFVTNLRLEIPHLTSNFLITLVENCIEAISKNNDCHYSWKEILPECLRLLSNRGGYINHYDSQMNAAQFVVRCLHTLCQAKWHSSVVTPLAAMFLDIQLPKEEHLLVVNKLCYDLEKIDPDSLPPLLHQLLRLCKERHGSIIYFRLHDYFYNRLYNPQHAKRALQDSESPIMDFDSIDEYSDNSIQKTEATCIYYACKGGSAFKKFLASLKGLIRRPSVLLSSPTIIQILLAFEEQRQTSIQTIRSAFYYFYFEEYRKSEYAWCKEILVSNVDVKQLVHILIQNNAKYCHITGEGLLSLAVLLIGSNGLFPTNKSLQKLGKLILVKLIKEKPEAAQYALKMIRDQIGAESSNVQHLADALKILSTTVPHTMMENTVILQGIIEDCLSLPEGRDWSENRAVIKSMSKIVYLDSRLRDSLVMICRKGLFSRDPNVGCVAVCGFLSLIKTFRNSLDLHIQDDSCSFSVLSQISISVHSLQNTSSTRVNNSAVCMEVVSLLRRCFFHNFEVREQLYLGLPCAIHGKPELLDTILNILYEHLARFYVSDVESLPPLEISKCLTNRENSVELQEPLGRLLFIIQKLLVCEQPAPGSDAPGGWSLSSAPETFNGISGKLYGIILSITNRMSKCTPASFDLINDISTESLEKVLTLQQILSCYEALMAFRINEWTPTKTDQPQKLVNLHKAYIQFLDFIKTNNSKQKKDAVNKKNNRSQSAVKDKENEVNNSQETSTAKKGKNAKKRLLKFSDLTKNRSAALKVPSTMWDVYTFSRALDLLYSESVKWASEDQLNQIRTKREIHRFIIKQGISVIQSFKNQKLKNQNYTLVCKCATILYQNCISKLETFSDYDPETALLTVECFHEILQIIIKSNSNDNIFFQEFLSSVCKFEVNEHSKNISKLIETLEKQLLSAIENISLNDDPSLQKIIPSIFQIISTLLQHLPSDDGIHEKWISWLQDLTTKCENVIKSLGSSIITTLLNISPKLPNPWPLYENLSKTLYHIMGTSDSNDDAVETENDKIKYKFLDQSSSAGVYIALCSHLTSRLISVETVIGRIRADYAYLQYRKPEQLTTARASLKNRERIVCSELCQSALIIRQMSIILTPPGPCCDAIIRIVSKLHIILASLTTHFQQRDFQTLQSARFEKLVKLCGKSMTNAMDCLISHIEAARDNHSNKAKAQARALKDTKNIPRLVYNCEQFYKKIHQLNSKIKEVDLVRHLSKGSARDFRIKAATVKEALKSNLLDNEEEMIEIDENTSDMNMDVSEDNDNQIDT